LYSFLANFSLPASRIRVAKSVEEAGMVVLVRVMVGWAQGRAGARIILRSMLLLLLSW
jgi:hypothetical protein